jgi:hypothetical protein
MGIVTGWTVEVKTVLHYNTEAEALEAAEEIEQEGIEEAEGFVFGYLDWETTTRKISKWNFTNQIVENVANNIVEEDVK